MRVLEKRLPPVLLVALCGAAGWAVAGRWPGPVLPEPVWDAGTVILGALGLFVCLAGLRAFARVGTTVDPTRPEGASSLVVTGIYRFTRNPMYLGFVLLLAAWAFRLGSLWALVTVPLCMLWLSRFQIVPEERALRERFGADFDIYCRRVRRWL
ncbi:methyltransferase family protein [Wenzhouxiangella marina]|uniref:Isoprenylcysteine carboxyl methyltransferase n=1 Tax=Wenzhouxiangella marina TaxID=1579979 RepID=A0A0K0Y0B1_9GAMM|nr:isoprenylcysteine carboxylmethyltransferase family protein [Wenzhouxiangella marina]AKS43374.1 Isoprenylcysteine carboxyl methyltransferase [Wenzhouxiangella marina]MBB6088510.1 protein-S-isoprenylcysteine O-methyltransferase Ste14 [Wenzhouxiangella marina]